VIDAIHSAAKEMVERLENDDPPPPQWTHPTAEQAVKSLWDCVSGKVVTLDGEATEAWMQVTTIKAAIKDLDAQLREQQARVLWAMGDAEIGRLLDAGRELKRISVAESLIKQADVDKARRTAEEMAERIGEVKRKRYSYLRERKAKP